MATAFKQGRASMAIAFLRRNPEQLWGIFWLSDGLPKQIDQDRR